MRTITLMLLATLFNMSCSVCPYLA